MTMRMTRRELVQRGAAGATISRKSGTFAWSDAVLHTVENFGKTE